LSLNGFPLVEAGVGTDQSDEVRSVDAVERLGIPPARLLESVRWLDSSEAV
jgi:hypothetical protein